MKAIVNRVFKSGFGWIMELQVISISLLYHFLGSGEVGVIYITRFLRLKVFHWCKEENQLLLGNISYSRLQIRKLRL